MSTADGGAIMSSETKNYSLSKGDELRIEVDKQNKCQIIVRKRHNRQRDEIPRISASTNMSAIMSVLLVAFWYGRSIRL